MLWDERAIVPQPDGCQDSNWEIPGWSVIITADARSRFSGIGIFISKRVAPSDHLSYHAWIPGRLLHVRCHTDSLTLDIIGGYQHVWQHDVNLEVAALRSRFWEQLSKLLQSLPGRNMVVFGMDANTQLQPVPGACRQRSAAHAPTS